MGEEDRTASVARLRDELEKVRSRIAPRFARREVRQRVGRYLEALLEPGGRRTGRRMAERMGEETPDGAQRLLTTARAGLLLGVDPSATRTESEVVLHQGSTLLLYTDGLVERRDQVFDDGIDLLGRTLAEEVDRPVDQMCDALLRRLVPGRAEDDVALVAVRLLPRTEEG